MYHLVGLLQAAQVARMRVRSAWTTVLCEKKLPCSDLLGSRLNDIFQLCLPGELPAVRGAATLRGDPLLDLDGELAWSVREAVRQTTVLRRVGMLTPNVLYGRQPTWIADPLMIANSMRQSLGEGRNRLTQDTIGARMVGEWARAKTELVAATLLADSIVAGILDLWREDQMDEPNATKAILLVSLAADARTTEDQVNELLAFVRRIDRSIDEIEHWSQAHLGHAVLPQEQRKFRGAGRAHRNAAPVGPPLPQPPVGLLLPPVGLALPPVALPQPPGPAPVVPPQPQLGPVVPPLAPPPPPVGMPLPLDPAFVAPPPVPLPLPPVGPPLPPAGLPLPLDPALAAPPQFDPHVAPVGPPLAPAQLPVVPGEDYAPIVPAGAPEFYADAALREQEREEMAARPPPPPVPGDITTQPGTKIVFNAPYDDVRTYHIKIINSSARRIGWAIKTTNIVRLVVNPGSGVRDPQEETRIDVSCNAFDYGQQDTNNDRISIDWTNTPEGAGQQFRREWFLGDGLVRRKNLPIEYNP